jgi:hypothetical protein
MQDMSPDMEDLMRKASEAYPLKETDDRWDEIASKIKTPAPTTELKTESGYKKYFASILLLLLFLFVGFFFFNKTGVDKFRKPASIQTDKPNEDIKPAQNYNLEKAKQLLTNKSNITVQENAGKHDLYSEKDKYKLSTTKQKAIDNNNLNKKNVNDDEEIDNYSNLVSNNNEPAIIFKKQNVAINKLEVPFDYPEFSLHPKTFFFNWDNSVLSSQKRKGGFYNRGFYYGLVGGPGFNTIKNQEFKKAGWNIGLVGGYYFSKKFSVETGLLFSQKYYTTMGDYFSMKEIGSAMPSAMKIMAVDGYSKMIEIPVLFCYDFIQNNKRSFFSLAGFSSYMLTNEDNQYHTSMNGTEEMMYGTYKNNKRYFAASLDLGVGYAQKFGNKNNIRFQPYLQIPLKGVGVGNLQIMGAGLLIAIIRQAH